MPKVALEAQVVEAVVPEKICESLPETAPEENVQPSLESQILAEPKTETHNETQEQPVQNGHSEPAIEIKENVEIPESQTEIITESEKVSALEQSQSLPTQNEQHVQSETIVDEKQQEIVDTDVRFDYNDAHFKSTFDFWSNFY